MSLGLESRVPWSQTRLLSVVNLATSIYCSRVISLITIQRCSSPQDERKFSMRRVQNFLLFGIGLLLLLPTLAFGHGPKGGGAVSVRGYVKSNGTYVQPHMRSAPDGNFSDNWSTIGNVNPYTGTLGTKTQPSGASGYISADGGTTASPTGPAGTVDGASAARSGDVDSSSTGGEYSYQSDVKAPLHAKLNYLRNGWVCERGYHQAGQECVAVQIPGNAKLNYVGTGWVCERGL